MIKKCVNMVHNGFESIRGWKIRNIHYKIPKAIKLRPVCFEDLLDHSGEFFPSKEKLSRIFDKLWLNDSQMYKN